MSIGNVIKSIQDIMRKDVGVDGDAQRISQMAWMLFLKIFSDREAEYELTQDKYKSPIPKKYLWHSWASNPEGITGEDLIEFINNDLFKNLKSFELDNKNPRGAVAKSVFEDAYNYMKSGQLLRQVCNKINEVDFNRTEDRHLFGDIYENILKDLQSAGNAGEFYTPRGITEFMVDIMDPKLGERVLDPACGTGGFLTCTIEHLKEKYVKSVKDRELLQTAISGVEKKPLPHLLCITNMLLHGIEVPTQIRHDNTLSRPLRDYTSKDRVDIILTNPPFGGMEEDGIETNFPAAFRTKETADLFLVLILNLLKDGGRAAVVLPDGSLDGEGVKFRIKEELLKTCNLHTVLRLPRGAFNPYTSIPTNILFFEKGKPTKDVWFYEHPYPEGQKSYNKGNPIKAEEFEGEKRWWNDRKESEFAFKVSIEQIIEADLNLGFKNPNRRSVQVDLSTEVNSLRDIQLQAESIFQDIKKELEIKYDLQSLNPKFSLSDLSLLIGDVQNAKSLKNIFVDLAVRGKIKDVAIQKAQFEKKTLGEVLTLEYGKSLPKKIRNENGSVPVFGSNGVVGTHDAALIDVPAIVVGRKGSAGALNISNAPFWPIDTTYYVIPPVGFDMKFLFYLLQNLRLPRLTRDIVPGLNRNKAHTLEVEFPNEEIQKSIVTVLEHSLEKVDELSRLFSEIKTQRQFCAEALEQLTAPPVS